jgi:uncharacterized protein (TIGR02172 family)
MTSLGAPIATGLTAEVFAWKAGWVLKLFRQGIGRKAVEWEAHISRLVYGKGMPIPTVGEVLEINDRFGLEYERVDGVSMLEAISKRPWKFFGYAHQLAELQARMHQVNLPEMPTLRERLQHQIGQAKILPDDVRKSALNELEKLPDQDCLCHGDFHPGNIILSLQGPVIIDWIDASRGYPPLDVARSTLLFGGGSLPPGMPRILGLIRSWFYRAYLGYYTRLNPLDQSEMDHWLPVLAAARLNENITYDEQRLLVIAHRLVSTSRMA